MEEQKIKSGNFYRINVYRIGVVFGTVSKILSTSISVKTTRGDVITIRKSDIIRIDGENG